MILCDASGTGPLVSTHNFADLRRLNFGLRALSEPLGVDAICAEIARYDAADAREVSRRLRAVGGTDVGIDRLVEVYERVIAEWRDHPRDAAQSEQQAVAAYLRDLAPRLSWDQSPRAILYAWVRRLYFGFQRVPLLRRLLPGRQAAQRWQERLRS